MIPKKYLYHEEWNTGIQKKNTLETPADIPKHLKQHKTYWLTRKYHFQADPFLVEHDNKLYVFYEAFNHNWLNGQIRCRVLDTSFHELEDFEVKDVNKLGCHLSFPYVFLHKGDYYMIPETYQDKKVHIFKATSFPYRWALVKTAVQDKKLLDSTILIKKMVNDKGDESQRLYLISSTHKHNKLVIYVANELTGDWQEYKGNISVADHHNRLGGGVIRLNNKTYMPFQERHSGVYGRSVFIKPVDIDDNGWCEQVGEQVLPFYDEYPSGLHTLNITDNYIVVDVKRELFQPFHFFVRKKRQIAIFINKLLYKF